VSAVQVTAVFGAVTVILSMIVKLTALVEVTVGSACQVSRIRAWVVSGPVTVQGYDPLAAATRVNGGIGVEVVPPSRLMSMFTTAPTPRLWMKLMLWTSPMRQITAVLGEVIPIVGNAIVNGTLLTSLLAGLAAQLTRTWQLVEAGPVTVQL